MSLMSDVRAKGGDRAPSTPDLWNYSGSAAGRKTLSRLHLARCACGRTIVDDGTGLACPTCVTQDV